MTDIADHLAGTLERTGSILRGIDPQRWARPSTCTDWSVRELSDHLLGGTALTAAVLAGEDARARPEYADTPDADIAQTHEMAGRAVLDAVARPVALEQIVQVGFGPVPGAVAARLCLVETIVHGWDLAASTGQDVSFDDAAVEEALQFSQGLMGQIPPDRSPFDPSHPVADDAPVLDRLVALLGRSPSAPAAL